MMILYLLAITFPTAVTYCLSFDNTQHNIYSELSCRDFFQANIDQSATLFKTLDCIALKSVWLHIAIGQIR